MTNEKTKATTTLSTVRDLVGTGCTVASSGETIMVPKAAF